MDTTRGGERRANLRTVLEPPELPQSTSKTAYPLQKEEVGMWMTKTALVE